MAHDHVLMILGSGFLLLGKGPLAECDDCPAEARVPLVNNDESAIPLHSPVMLFAAPTTTGVGFAMVPIPVPFLVVDTASILAFQPIDGIPLADSYRGMVAGLTLGRIAPP
jgi:hypothetical protein